MCNNNYDLNRFIEAQNRVYPTVLQELQNGRKRSHWMWYIFPQLKHLGHSYTAKYFGISAIEEAVAYLQHPILDQRLREVSSTILGISSSDAVVIFGRIDSRKLKSCMTLFDAVQPNDIFSQVLDKFFSGKRDRRTIKILNL